MKKSQTIGLATVVAFVAVAVFLSYRYGPGSQGDMLARLPTQGAAVGHVDVGAVRRAGLVDASSSAALREPEYEAFIKKSGFNWEKDLDRITWAFATTGKYFVVEGRFDWDRLEEFVVQEGGSCRDRYCTVRGSQPGREISFFPLKKDVMALAVSADRYAADQMRQEHTVDFAPPDAPIWIHFSKEALNGAEPESPGLQGFARILRQTERATLLLQPEGENFLLRLQAQCDSPETAQKMADELNTLTSWLQQLLKIENTEPGETEFAGVLAEGEFRADKAQLLGTWPISRGFLGSILVEP